MESPGVLDGSLKTSPVIPLLSIPFESLLPRNKTDEKEVGDVDSVIPSLMSLTLSPPKISQLSSPPKIPRLTFTRLRSHRNESPKPPPPPSFQPRSFDFVEVERTNKTRREFAFVAREVTRGNFEPPAGSRLLFGYYTYPSGKKELVGVASFQNSSPFSSKASEKEDRELFFYDFYNLIHYIFLLRDFRGFGYGGRMVQDIERRFRGSVGPMPLRPVRVQAGTRAVSFFEKQGYQRVSIGKDSLCCGTPIFRTLYNMTKQL